MDCFCYCVGGEPRMEPSLWEEEWSCPLRANRLICWLSVCARPINYLVWRQIVRWFQSQHRGKKIVFLIGAYYSEPSLRWQRVDDQKLMISEPPLRERDRSSRRSPLQWALSEVITCGLELERMQGYCSICSSRSVNRLLCWRVIQGTLWEPWIYRVERRVWIEHLSASLINFWRLLIRCSSADFWRLLIHDSIESSPKQHII